MNFIFFLWICFNLRKFYFVFVFVFLAISVNAMNFILVCILKFVLNDFLSLIFTSAKLLKSQYRLKLCYTLKTKGGKKEKRTRNDSNLNGGSKVQIKVMWVDIEFVKEWKSRIITHVPTWNSLIRVPCDLFRIYKSSVHACWLLKLLTFERYACW